MTDAAISLHDFIDAFGDSVPEDIHPSALCGSSVPRSRVSRPNTTDIGSTERQIPKFSGFGKESSMATTSDPSAAADVIDEAETPDLALPVQSISPEAWRRVVSPT
jgi:hypothetical protein